ncbi:DNA polymerase V [Nymphaea thermarum]|nr:DNA polymerase V [Nymphaea thermarum]
MEGKKNVSEGKKRSKKQRREDAEVLGSDNEGKEGGDGIAVAQKSDMEKKKKRKQMDKERHRIKSAETKELVPKKVTGPSDQVPALQPSSKSVQGFHIDIFRDLSSVEVSARESAVEALVKELQKVQEAYEKSGGTVYEGNSQLEAEKDEGLKSCAPSLRYALRRLIRGVSSSRECARQGFALGLTAVLGTIQRINTDSILELIDNLLEVSSSMKGQEARDCLLGRLFAYGALARSGRVAHDWSLNNKTSTIKEFIRVVISLADKKSYLREPAVSIILELADTLPVDAVAAHILEAPALADWFDKAISNENPDALYLALKLREKASADNKIFCKLLPWPFTPSNLFTPDCLSSLVPCLKETTFCQPRMHSVWPVLVNILFSDVSLQKDGAACSDSTQALKKCRKLSSTEKNLSKRLDYFCSLVIDGSLLMSSHDRKHLAFDILLLLLPRLPASCSKGILSYKLIQCLMDILSTKDSWLYKAAQYFLQELSKWAERDVDRLVAVIIALQQHSFGRFDCITHTHMVKDLVSKINSASGCMLFVQSLMSLFIDENGLPDKGSAQATIESSEMITLDDSSYTDSSGNPDILRSWIVDSLPRVFKYLTLELEEKLHIQREILKFLTVQGLFTASLGREVTSFELQEKLKWPKTDSSGNVRKICFQQLQLILADAEKSMGTKNESDMFRTDDLGSYFMHFLDTLCNIPSVSLFRSLSKEDEQAFKKLQSMESRLLKMEEREIDGSKVYAMRFLLIQLLLQVLLKPGEFSETASELVICCKKAFVTLADLDSNDEEEDDDTGSPAFMDVLVDTLLSLLPQSAPLVFSIEQVFKFFCDQITESGLVSMLRVVKKDLKPSRHQYVTDEEEDDDDDEDDFLGIEESEDVDQAGDSDGDQSESSSEDEDAEESADQEVAANVIGAPLGSDDSDGGMDDEEMFRMDSYLAQIFKDRKNAAGSDTAQSQLVLFKLRVLSLLEIFLHKNAGKLESNPLVLVAYPYLVKTFVNAYATEGSEQLGQRIAGILQKKLFKSKDYPKGDGVQSSLLETQLEKSLRLSSRSRQKVVSILAQNSSFWILKILHGNFSRKELSRVPDMLQSLLDDYFNNKKSRLKSGFIKEIFRRYPWTGHRLFSFLLEKCTSTKSEYRMNEALALIEGILKTWVSGKTHVDEDALGGLQFLRENLLPLCSLMQQLLSKPMSKGSRRSDVRRFFISALQAIACSKLSEAFCKALRPDAYAACESYLGDKFHPLLKFDDGVSEKNINREEKKN